MTRSVSDIRLLLVGSSGRMGTAIDDFVEADAHSSIAGRITRGSSVIPTSTTDLVILDFSSDAGTNKAINLANELETPILIGTTNLQPSTLRAAERTAASVPVLIASNTSVGVALLNHLLIQAATILRFQPGFRVSCSETHHAGKLDAPSGTAISLANTLSDKGLELPLSEISSRREGNVVGEHEIRLENGLERLTLRHEALDRSLFASGAVELARMLLGRPPGLHQVADLLQFPDGASGKP